MHEFLTNRVQKSLKFTATYIAETLLAFGNVEQSVNLNQFANVDTRIKH